MFKPVIMEERHMEKSNQATSIRNSWLDEIALDDMTINLKYHQ